jgi:ABC-type uncharacterized transport system ATPase subunit
MSLLLAFVGAHIGVFLTGLLGLGVSVATWFHGRSTVQAKADEQVQAAKTEVQVAQMSAADAKADAEQAKDSARAAKVLADSQVDANSMNDDELNAALAKLGALRKD